MFKRKINKINSSLFQFQKLLNYNIKGNAVTEEQIPKPLVRIKERRLEGEEDEYQDISDLDAKDEQQRSNKKKK